MCKLAWVGISNCKRFDMHDGNLYFYKLPRAYLFILYVMQSFWILSRPGFHSFGHCFLTLWQRGRSAALRWWKQSSHIHSAWHLRHERSNTTSSWLWNICFWRRCMKGGEGTHRWPTVWPRFYLVIRYGWSNTISDEQTRDVARLKTIKASSGHMTLTTACIIQIGYLGYERFSEMSKY